MELIKVYDLIDPIRNEVFYVGITKLELNKRLAGHLADSKYHEYNRATRIREILQNRSKPIITLIDEVPKAEWRSWEKFYIQLYKSWGFILENSNEGGGGACECKPETKEKLSKKNKGRILPARSETTRKRISLGRLGIKFSEETKKKMSLNNARRGKPSIIRRAVVKLDNRNIILNIYLSAEEAAISNKKISVKHILEGAVKQPGFCSFIYFDDFKKLSPEWT